MNWVRQWRACVRVVLFLLWTSIALPIYFLTSFIGGPLHFRWGSFWCSGVCRILGLHIRFSGTPVGGGPIPTLYVVNHVSYLDILLVYARIPAVFIAKTEVAGWPLFGLLGRLSNTMFIRRRPLDALIQRNELARRLNEGQHVVLFAEGTSSIGSTVLPFKSSLFSVAEPGICARPIQIQPLSLTVTRHPDGRPMSEEDLPRYAWYGDADFLPHMARMLSWSGAVIELACQEPVQSETVVSRKVLTRDLHRRIRQAVESRRRLIERELESPALEADQAAALSPQDA
ncbi:MAG: lysophospholipid acyltransferase family protein [Geminicoccaceae bacterium]